MKTYFLGMKQELLIIYETEEGYTYSSHLNGTQPTRLAFDPQDERRIYCATKEDGLWLSENGGEAWKQIGENEFTENRISSKKITAVAVDPVKKVNGNSVVYAGTEPSMLFYSEYNGSTWSEFVGIHTLPSKRYWSFPPRPYTHYIRWIAPSFSSENHIGVSVEAGAVFRTENYGNIWFDRTENSPIDVHTLLAHPNSPGRLYAACGDGSSNPKNAYAESKDGGETWEYMSKGIENHPYLYHMVLHPTDPDDRLVSASENASKAHRSSLYSTVYRKIGKEPWKEVAEGLPLEGAFIHNLAADPTEKGVFYALNNHGIYRLEAGEETWSRLDINWEEDYINQKPSCFEVKEW